MLIQDSFKEMYDKEFNYNSQIRYTGKIKGYNGNISLRARDITVSLARNWEDISDDIKKGLIQTLMNKLFKTKVKTYNIDLYNIFLKNIHFAIPKDKLDPILVKSFNRINQEYFNDNLEMPNLSWGNNSYRKLGSYDYGKDEIIISSALKEAENEIIDFIMYHEALHKKIKFKHNTSRSSYHTKEFKTEEKRYKNYEQVNKDLENYLRKKRIKRFFKLW